MSNLGYVPLSDDLIEDLSASAITIYDEDTDYPETLMQSQPMAECSRATDPGGGIHIDLDLGSNKNPKFWSILNHNIASGNVIIRSYTDAFITPSGETLTLIYRALDMKGYRSTDWTSARYFRVDLSACTFNDAYFEWGKLIAALDITFFSADYSPGVSRALVYDSIHNPTEAGVVWTYLKRGPYYEFGIRFDKAVVSKIRDELETFWNEINGAGYPVILIPDNDETEFYYARSSRDTMTWTEAYNRALLSGLGFNFIEESRGLTQSA